MISVCWLAACCFLGQADRTVESLAFSPHGKLLAVGRADGRVSVFDVPSDEERFSLEVPGQKVFAVAFSPDGSWLVAGGTSGYIHCWDVATRKLVKRWQANSEPVAALAFVPHTKTLACGTYDSQISFWTVREGRLDKQWQAGSGPITSLAFSVDGKTLVSGGTANRTLNIRGNSIGTSGADEVRLWNMATGKAKSTNIHGACVALSPDGRFLAAGGSVTEVRETSRASGAIAIGIGGGKSLVIGNIDRIDLVDLTDRQPPRPLPWKGHLVAISPNGQWLATGGQNNRHSSPGMIGITARKDNRLCLWNLADGKRVLRVPQEDATAVAFSPNSLLLAAGDPQGKVTCWDVAKEQKQPTLDPSEQFPATEDELLLELQRDFEELLKQEPRADLVREAKGLIYRGNFADGVALLRQHRPKAAIPLLLRAWVDWQAQKKSVWYTDPEELASSWMILTGQVLDAGQPARKAVEAVVTSWWRPNKAKISLDLAAYSPAQFRVIARLVGADVEADRQLEPALALAERIDMLLHPDPAWRTWWDEDVHPGLLPWIFQDLERVGASFQPLEWKYLPMLHTLARSDQGHALLKVAEDDTQPARVRIPCLWAYTLAQEKLPTTSVLTLLRKEKRLEHRLALLLLLEHGKGKDVAEALLQALADPHRQIRQAALLALRGPKPPEAVPVLRKMLLDSRPDVWPQTLADALTRYRSRAAQAALLDYLETTLDWPRAPHVGNALHAVEETTGKRFLDAKDPTDDDLRAAARRALKWWRAQ